MKRSTTNKSAWEETLAQSPTILMEGALGERLKREWGLRIDGPAAMAPLADDPKGREGLIRLWSEYAAIAQRYKLPFWATTPTRRANQERMHRAGLDESLFHRHWALLNSVRQQRKTPMFIGGLMGCRGDAYTGEGCLEVEPAFKLHRWQARALARAGVDFLYAGIMPTLPEALGMARAMAETGLPYIISFTIRRTGTLVDGTPIDAAIGCIDRETQTPPALYMTNCVHPAIAYEALAQPVNRTERIALRFKGIQANTSALDYDRLDHSADLQGAAPEALAHDMMRLKRDMGLTVLGGCCGTDGRHMEAIARAATARDREKA